MTKSKKIAIILILGMFVFTNFAGAALVPDECQRQFNNGKDCKLTSLKGLAINIINFLILSAGIVTLLFVLFGGMKMLLSGGNPEQIKAGKTTLYNALLGLLLVAAAYLIINTAITVLSGNSINGLDDILKFLK